MVYTKIALSGSQKCSEKLDITLNKNIVRIRVLFIVGRHASGKKTKTDDRVVCSQTILTNTVNAQKCADCHNWLSNSTQQYTDLDVGMGGWGVGVVKGVLY